MIQKKVCMLGGFAVGKTSLVSHFVRSIFSEKYLTTIGVKIDKKTVEVDGQTSNLILWDIHGEDEFQTVQASHLRGASGYLLVVDGTRCATLDQAYTIQTNTNEVIGDVPFVLLINKTDLIDEWDIDDRTLEELSTKGWTMIQTSAKTGSGVEEAFLTLAQKMLKRDC